MTSVSAITNVTAFVGADLEPERVDIHIDGGLIERIAPAAAAEPDGAHAVLDGTGMLAFPGMVDAHDHLRVLGPGLTLGEGVRLDAFLQTMWETQAQMGVTEYRLGALLGTLQRLKTGITTVVDHCYTFHVPGLDEASLDGYEASGVRWLYARGVMTRPYAPVCETWVEAEAAIRGLVSSGRVVPERLFVAPVSIRQATPEDYARSVELARSLDCGLYTHLAETAAERDTWWQACGATPVHALDELGFLTPRTVLVHCVLLDDDEIEVLATRGVSVVHCPSNNMKLAKGFTRVPDLLAAGVNVCLGIDMMADMLAEMRAEIGMHAAARLDPAAVSKRDAMQMATSRGARALGLGALTGTLAPGLAADIVLLDARSLLQAPLLDPAYALLYATHAGHVRHVLVDGRLVVRDGVSTLVDEAALLAEVEGVAASWLARIGVQERPWFARSGDRSRDSGPLRGRARRSPEPPIDRGIARDAASPARGRARRSPEPPREGA